MATAFACPDCGTAQSDVVDSRPTHVRGRVSVRRRRVCRGCKARFTTFEVLEADIAGRGASLTLRRELMALVLDFSNAVERRLFNDVPLTDENGAAEESREAQIDPQQLSPLEPSQFP